MTPRIASARTPRGVWITTAAVVALLLAVAGRYGFHRDELYFIVAGRRLDWGFVDQPPLTPLVARLSESLLGTSPVVIRLLPALAVGAVVLLTAHMARRMRGSVKAQVLAAVAAAGTGVLLGEGHLLSTAVFDFLAWTAVLTILVMLLDGADARWWVALGAVVGLGLQNKHTVALLAAAILVAVAITRRPMLASIWPWAGGGVALLIALPNLVWQARHSWPQLEMASALRERSDGALAFLLLQPALLSITLIVPVVAGAWWLARSPEAGRFRPIVWIYLLLLVVLATLGAKAYYVAPAYTPLLAAGAVWLAESPARTRRLVEGVTAPGILLGAFVALPLLPPALASGLDATGELGETVGWNELVATVRSAVESIPEPDRADAVVLTISYGEAAAVDVLGGDLPPAASGHNNYWLWGPPPGQGPIVVVGPVQSAVAEICPRLERVATVTNPFDVENETAGYPVSLCLEPTRPPAAIWGRLRHYN